MRASGAGEADRCEREAAPPSLPGVEAVADAPHGLDRAGLLRVVLHLRAEALDGHVDEPGVAEVVVVPDALQQELASEDLARAPGELEQQPELRGAQAQLLAAALGDEGAGVDLEIAANEDGLLVIDGRRSPDGRPSAGDRKSTRLNSSHITTSYAVFCLKKKK